MRKIIYIILIIITFLAGWYSHYFLRGEDSVSYHWKKLAEFQEYMENLDNYEASGGLMSSSVPFDNIPHLEALVWSGELEKRNVIIPNLPVSSELATNWMKFSNNPSVMYASSQGEYYDGEIPLIFTIWYKPSFEDELNQYIETLEKMANKSQ